MADKESRLRYDPRCEVLRQLARQFCEKDHHLTRAVAIDAFTISWNEYFYTSQPFCLLGRVLAKIEEKTNGILVALSGPLNRDFLK